MRAQVLIVWLIVGGSVGCKARPATVAATAAPAPATVAPPEAPYIHSIAETMKQEAASRPSGTPRAEDLIKVAKEKGISFTEPRQVLANKGGAKFCSMTSSPSGLEISVCEFASEADAKQGRDFSEKAFGSIPNRDLHINRKTVLTVMRGQSTPPIEAEAKQAAQIFAGL